MGLKKEISSQRNSAQFKANFPTQFRAAAFAPATYNKDTRTIDVVWTTGDSVPRQSADIGEFSERLCMDASACRLSRLNSGAPVLNSHASFDLSNVIGVVERAWISGDEGHATIRFSDREDVKSIVADVSAGILRNISIGYAVYKYERAEGDDEGKPVYNATDWEPFEISFVPIPADARAQVRASDKKNECIFFGSRSAERDVKMLKAKLKELVLKLLLARGVKVSKRGEKEVEAAAASAAAAAAEVVSGDVSESQAEKIAKSVMEAVLQSLSAGERAGDGDEERAEDEDEDKEDECSRTMQRGIEAERKRQVDIRQAAALLPQELRGGMESHLIDSGASVESARKEVLSALVKAQATINGNVRVSSGDDARDKWLAGATNWLLLKSGMAPKLGDAAKNLHAGGFRGMRLMDLARNYLERAGVRTNGMDVMSLAGHAFQHRWGMNTTSDFAVLLENTMHKMLLAEFAVTPDTWQNFCAVGSVSDFRDHNRYRMGSFGVLEELSDAGEYKNKNIPDGMKEKIRAKTKGNIVAISRQTIINDDMGAFSQLMMMLGRAAKLSVEVDVYAALALNGGMGPLLQDGKPIFHTDHANISSNSILSVEGLDNDRVQMAKQKDPSGNKILDLRPEILLVPVELGGNARVLNEAQYDPDTPNRLQKPNMVNGLFKNIVDTARLTGTRRYIFANASSAPVLEVAFLDGQREPVLETKDGWRQDGAELRVRYDYAVGGIGWHGAVTNAGTA